MDKKIKKFSDFEVDTPKEIEGMLKNESNGSLNDMPIGLDLTKIYNEEYVLQKTIEYRNEHNLW